MTPDALAADMTTRTKSGRLPVWRLGIAGGLVGILCCVGPTVLALLGIVSAATAFTWATDLYDNYGWWFRLGGLAVLTLLVWLSLPRRNQCNVAGMRRWRWRLLAIVAIAVATYGATAYPTWSYAVQLAAGQFFMAVGGRRARPARE